MKVSHMFSLPKWTTEFVRFLSVTPQFTFTGNILDVYPVEMDGNLTTLRLKDYIRTILVKEGYDVILGLEPFVGFSHLHGDPDTIHAILGDVLSVEKTGPPSLERTIQILQKSVDNRTAYSAIILNQVTRHDDRYYASEKFYFNMFCACQNAEPRLLAGSSFPRFNLIIWIHDRDASLPSWYTQDNTRVRQIVIPRPDLDTRRALLKSLTKNVQQFESQKESEKIESLSLLIKKTQDLQANEIISLISLVRREILSVSDLREAVVQYSSGLADNFWRTIDRRQIENASDFLEKRVFGQKHAIKQVCDLLNQAYLGLSHSQYNPDSSQPRGFVLLAGHEGVGKTALASAIKELLLGPDRDMIALNMGDYQDDDAGRRILTLSTMDNGNFLGKVRNNPYSVVLFENVELAHPAVLKNISSIIRAGEIISENGHLISFSGCFIICTIRLSGCCPDTYQHLHSKEETNVEYLARERAAYESITHFFEENKNIDFTQFVRGNTIIFRSIQPDSAKLILETMINRIFDKISTMYHINLMISPQAMEKVEEYCCHDLSRGGISIGQRVETMLIHPLSHILMTEKFTPEEKVIITHISDSETGWEVGLSRM